MMIVWIRAQSARKKVQMAEDGWNTRNPEKVSLAYTPGETSLRCGGAVTLLRGATGWFLVSKCAFRNSTELLDFDKACQA